jgi:pSer/pThr/pTyr-binding forkhead associated (FHA) protein
VPADEISRRHALIKPTPEGLSVEDLGSSNGTFINGKRVQHGFLNPGDELRLDAVRFILVAPGMEMATAQVPKMAPVAAARTAGNPNYMKWAMLMLVTAVVIMMVVLLIKR